MLFIHPFQSLFIQHFIHAIPTSFSVLIHSTFYSCYSFILFSPYSCYILFMLFIHPFQSLFIQHFIHTIYSSFSVQYISYSFYILFMLFIHLFQSLFIHPFMSLGSQLQKHQVAKIKRIIKL